MVDGFSTGVYRAAADARRVLIYSHDTFGLGHLRRSRTIAQALVAAHPDIRVVILSGSPIVDRYAYGPNIETIAMRPVTKRKDGGYASLDPEVPLRRTVESRSRTIANTVASFDPHLLIVDKEPTGFHGELLPVLDSARLRGTKIVLGVRDVLDEAGRLRDEWDRKGAADALCRHYDEVWIYGIPCIHRPLSELPIETEIAERLVYTGYLRRAVTERGTKGHVDPLMTGRPFLLVTPGGGSDGDGLIDWVIAAYEADATIPLPSLIAFGPFMDRAVRDAFFARIARLPDKLAAIDFDSEIERLMARASGVIAMGGYNTFCEILSFDKRAILVPRTHPRLEQSIRATAAHSLGLARTMHEHDGRSADRMAAAIRELPHQPLPSKIVIPGLLDGLEVVGKRFAALVGAAESTSPLAQTA